MTRMLTRYSVLVILPVGIHYPFDYDESTDNLSFETEFGMDGIAAKAHAIDVRNRYPDARVSVIKMEYKREVVES